MIHGVVSDGTAWGEWVAIWPPLFWVVGLAPLALLTYDRRKPLLFCCAVGGVALFGAAFVEWGGLARLLVPVARVGAVEARLRLVSWNVAECPGGKKGILDELAAACPDICFLQETPDGEQSIQPGDLKDYWDGFEWRDSGDCGILSRFRLENLRSISVGPWDPVQVFDTQVTSGMVLRGINARLMLPSLTLNVLSPERRSVLRADHDRRLRQYARLGELIDSMRQREPSARIVVAGDFNTPARMSSLGPLRRRLHDAWKEAGRGWGATITNDFPVERIDQCWVSGSIRVLDARVCPSRLSDHRMLIVDLAVRQ